MNGHFGIDLGTTNSAVVCNDPHRGFRTIGDPLDNNPTPSVVAIEKLNQKVSLGRAAKQRWLQMLESGEYHLVESVKSCLDKEDEFWLGHGRFWKPEGIAYELFRFLSKCASRAVGGAIDCAVIAIPVGMSAAKRVVLRRAAQAAGIEVQALVSEPTAACIAHLEEIRHCRYIAVFDWGGGTLDISVLELRDNCLTELHTIGWDKAGDHIDQRFAEWLHQRIAEEKRIKKSFGKVASHSQQALVNAAEECKRKLQLKDEDVVRPGKYEGKLVQQSVTQEEFNTLVKPMVMKAVDRLFNCVEEAGLSPKEIGSLLLVGGSSKLMTLDQELHRRWPSPNILTPPDAEWAIAKGAAILAANPGDFRLAEDVGLRLADGSFHTIFPIATKLDQARSILALGLVEDSRTASFIFETRKRDAVQPQSIGELHAEAFGFRDEVIALHSRITEDLILEAEVGSQSKPRAHRTFNYEELRWMYELPGIKR
jgi:molecular chaperone DnaK